MPVGESRFLFDFLLAFTILEILNSQPNALYFEPQWPEAFRLSSPKALAPMMAPKTSSGLTGK